MSKSSPLTAPDGGVFTTLVNPARPARVTTSQKGSAMADIQKVPGSAPRRRRRRNPSGAFNLLVKLLLPAAAGGAIAYLEAKPVENAWWHDLDDGIKAIVFAGVAYVAETKNMPQAAGAASTWAGFYAMRKGLAWYAEKNAPAGNKAGKGWGLKGLMDQQQLTPSQVDAALAQAIAAAESREGGSVQGIEYQGTPSDLMGVHAYSTAG